MTNPSSESGGLDGLCASRRVVLRGLAGATLLPGVLVACSDSDADSRDGGGDAAGSQTVPAADVPPGAAAVVRVGDRQLVVAQPTEGEFVAFSAVCTHQGTVVTGGSGTRLVCPSHGSEFEAADGSVQKGPATEPLEPVGVTLDGDALRFS